jgi:hypothetical protein
MDKTRATVYFLSLFTLLGVLSCVNGDSQKSSDAKDGGTISAGTASESESRGKLSVQFKRYPKLENFQEGVAEHFPGIGPTGRSFGVYHIVLNHRYSQGNAVSIQFDTKGEEKPAVGKYPVWLESQPAEGYTVIVMSGHIDGSIFTNQAVDGELKIVSSGEEIEGRFVCTIPTGGEPAHVEGNFTAVPKPKERL